MNVDCRASALIRKIEKHYHKENLTNSRYLILKRECDNSVLGLFAYYITNLAWIEYALRHHMTPVIDMKNYANTFHREKEVGRINTWELFFEQPCHISLEEALVSGKSRYVWNDIPEYQPSDSLDFLYNDEIISHYHSVAEKYIRFQPHVLKILKEKEREILDKYKAEGILGVLARGTDYTSLRPYFNPIQPDIDHIIQTIDSYCEKYGCKKIYVATEDETILERLKGIYADRLLYTDQQRVKKTTTYLNENKEFTDRDSFERGIEYLTSIYLLSRCNGLIAGRTSGTVGACIMSDHYEFKYIFSLGRYGLEDTMTIARDL